MLYLCPHPLVFHRQYLRIATIATFICECHFIRLLPYLSEHFIPIHHIGNYSFLKKKNKHKNTHKNNFGKKENVQIPGWLDAYRLLKALFGHCFGFNLLRFERWTQWCGCSQLNAETNIKLQVKPTYKMWSNFLSFVTLSLFSEKTWRLLTLCWCIYFSYYDTSEILSEQNIVLVTPQSVYLTLTDFSRQTRTVLVVMFSFL